MQGEKMNKDTSAIHPKQFSMGSWWQISKRVFKKIKRENVSLISAGVAFYFLLAIFPMLAALVSLYGLFVDQQTLSMHMGLLVGIVPEQSRNILEAQIESLISTDNSALSIGFVISFLLTIYSGGKGAVALITACNITYQENRHRSFFSAIVMRVLLTLATVLVMLIMLVLVVGIPLSLSLLNQPMQKMLAWTSWPLLLLVFHLSLSCLYRFAPHRTLAKWRWVTPGAFIATIVWLTGSYLFNFYVTEYARYNETYGSMGGVVILLMWFYLTAYTILLGAEVNAAAELQTIEDTTAGEEKPIGERGAYVANNGPGNH